MIISEANSCANNSTSQENNQPKNLCYIYRHIRLDTNIPFYIGKGTNTDGKYKRSKSKGDRNPYWKRIVDKHGYRIEIMLKNLSEEEANIKEQYFIKLYGRIDLKTGILVNMTDGGEGALGQVVTMETRERTIKTNLKQRGVEYPTQSSDVWGKIKQANLKNYGVENVSQSEEIKQKKKETFLQNYGVEYGLQSEEVIEKGKQTNLNKYGVDNYAKTKKFKDMMSSLQSKFYKRVGQFKDGNLIKEYPSIMATTEDGFKRSEVSSCCNGKAKSHKGFIWKFLEITDTPKQSKKVGQYKDGELIKEYPSISSTRLDGFVFQAVSKCCQGFHKSHKGFEWRFL